ncbi:metalloregulator ArsR/SmtB family transcription factor [Yoonia sp. SS1-5]|uniref:ArsR/SmtB family transcription factor n=1 Tax=Yoonia rhodophyticola TaxID=3137370 RepID=A0AAN0NI31_9RHOB
MTALSTLDAMDAAAEDAASLMKALSNPGRLRILCALVPGEMSVSGLEQALGASQSYVSGQLLRLRNDGLVTCERQGRVQKYRLADPRVRPVLERIYEVFCPDM